MSGTVESGRLTRCTVMIHPSSGLQQKQLVLFRDGWLGWKGRRTFDHDNRSLDLLCIETRERSVG